MSDLLSQENVDQFRAALRDLTDTFHKSPVILRKASGEEIDLLCGMKPDDDGSYGAVHGEQYVQEDRSETVERWVLSFNRDYLAEQGMVENDQVMIVEDDKIVIAGKRHTIVKLSDKALFRGLPVLFTLTVQR